MLVLWLFLFVLPNVNDAFPDKSKWSFTVNEKSCHYFSAHSALLQNSTVNLKITCDSKDVDTKINIGWVLRSSICFEEYIGSEVLISDYLRWYYYCPSTLLGDFGYEQVKYLKTEEIEVTCNHFIDLTPITSKFVVENVNSNASNQCLPPKMYCENSANEMNNLPDQQKLYSQIDIKNGYSITIPEDSVYLFLLLIRSQKSDTRFNATVDINFKAKSGYYLSAVDYPLLNFYAIMSCIYLLYALAWLIVSMIQWKELLRIQFYIAAVIFLGMLEKAIFYGVYQSMNSHGVLNQNVFYLAELFSCLKRTLARVLVIIVSCGYEIVKPHLGSTLNKIISIGIMYFTLSSLEATMRIYKPKSDPSNETFIAGIFLALLDSIICWWIFSNLVQTLKILRLRRNLVKLELFNYFTNVLIFSVLASIGFMIWQIHIHKLTSCLSDWKNIWFDEAYWHILFSIILLAIMILWRPTNNNQRYAFTPLLDVSEDENDDQDKLLDVHRLSDVGGEMKLRSNRQNSTDNDINVTISKETVDNLKWIEENISTTLVDTSLPTLADSDEELLNTKFEISKMQ